MTQVDRVHRELLLTGKGILLCILDNGIDYNHPALGGGFGPGHRVVVGKDVADNKSTPLDDCGINSPGLPGHGTHVAGISAGFDTSKAFVGVAPEATIGFWKVFFCERGTTSDDVVMNALLEARDNNCEVINMSLSAPNRGWSETAQAALVTKLTEEGLPVVVAASNEGKSGAFTLGSPGAAKKVLSVASIDNDYYLARLFEATPSSNPGEKLGPYVYRPEPSAFDEIPDGEVTLRYRPGSTDACSNNTVNPAVRGKLVLLRTSSGCRPEQEYNTIVNAGAVGVLYDTGNIAKEVGLRSSKIPIVGISATAADQITAIIENRASIFLHFSRAGFAQKLSTGGYVSEFSSVGPNNDLDLHPAIAGPGGEIFSTLPKYVGSWGSMSGTSMAAPYLTGAVALFVQAWKNKGQKVTPQFIFEQFQNYAVQTDTGTLNKGMVDNPIRQGSGMLQLYDAIQQTVHISPSQISFNDTASVQQYKTHVLTITNFGNEPASYRIRNKIATGIVPYKLSAHNLTLTPPAQYFTKSDANVTFTPSEVSIAPGNSQNVTVHVTVPVDKVNSTEHAVYGGYVHFETRQDVHKDITVPYFGIWGKQRDLPVIDIANTFLASNDRKIYSKDEICHVNLKDNSTYPFLYITLFTPSAAIGCDILDRDMKLLSSIAQDTYVDRTLNNKTALTLKFNDIFETDQDRQKLSGGQYRFRISALKAFGSIENDNDWETWVSSIVDVRLKF
ncbi:hypothetical protein DFQ28_011352 [Apophysomyces sp. BC1034]|nr:hypothetical protein DFQ30_011137 [Apophysomyces sp. BC1015]KAG0184350.1 hypothetical protein DFQ28_011352 [Apophysomyces sp. BC1034]